MKPKEILKQMGTLEYGWIDKQFKKHYKLDKTFAKLYIMQTPEEVIKNNIGVCWDQVELERVYFDKTNLPYKTYNFIYHDKRKYPSHTFLVYKEKNTYYWFENSWKEMRGIHPFNTLEELFKYVKENFIKYMIKTEINPKELYLFEYTEVKKKHIRCVPFYKHCEKGKNISYFVEEW